MIVVFVDGSDCSRAALEVALEEGVRRGTSVHVVSDVSESEHWSHTYGTPRGMLEDLSPATEKIAQGMVDAVVRERGGAVADVPIEVRARGRFPGYLLVSESSDADLLVVGHRGRDASSNTRPEIVVRVERGRWCRP